MIWSEKYKPEFSDLDALVSRKLREFVINFKKQRKKAIFIYGQTGSGKTSAIYALSNHLNYELFELNASELRNKEAIETVLGGVVKQLPLFKKGKIILIDDVDGISGTADRGGLQALLKIIELTTFPIIITSNSIEIEKLESLIKKTELLNFIKPNPDFIYKILKKICLKEKIQYDKEDLINLARLADGDIRAAILDLQRLTEVTRKLERKNLEELKRTNLEDIQQVLTNLFKKTDF